ncbi:MAG: hypothetical protein MUE73_12595 [Planctomycetes bacterium]|nr:hypothetical protein [Planctomycetota bacterium]
MRRPETLLCLFLLAAPATPAPVAAPLSTAAEATERGRDLDRILDQVLVPAAGAEKEPRVLVFVLDPTASLAQAGFAAKFEEALARAAPALKATRIAVARAGETGPVAFAEATGGPALATVARAVEAKPAKEIQNLFADVRRAAGALAGQSGLREIALVSFENGDAVDDLEATVSALRRAGVKFTAVAREAFLSDTFWLARGTRPVRDLEIMAGEAAFVEVPWGFLFQQADPTQYVSSGFAMYGFSRLASASGGRVFLYYPPVAGDHQCSPLGGCLFCDGDHVPAGESYEAHRLRALAPLAVPASEALAAAGHDPYYRAVLEAWERAAKEGLLRSRPSVRGGGGGLRVEKRPVGSAAVLGGSLAFASQASKAEDLARAADAAAKDLAARIAAIPRDAGGLDRYRAVAELTLMQLRIVRLNLLLFAGFCREAGPDLAAGECGPPPEVPFYASGSQFVGIGYSNFSLCHGLRPFREVRLPGGEAVKREILALEPLLDEYLARYDRTPFGMAIRKSGLARFTFTVRGTPVPLPDRKVPTSAKDDVPTERDRPDRGGGGSSGSGGTATGGD